MDIAWGWRQSKFSLGPVDITSTNQLGGGTDFIELTKTSATLTALGLAGTLLQGRSEAENALTQIDSALEIVGESRAFYGAKNQSDVNCY